MILIVTTAIDVHADAVITHLEEANVTYARFNTEDYPTRVGLTIRLRNNGWGGSLNLASGKVALSDVTAVWYRRPANPEVDSAVSDERARDVCLAQSQETLRGLWRSIDAFWMSYPINIQRAGSKILQLSIAPQLGFQIPDSIVTVDPQEVARFWHANEGDVAVKPLSGVAFMSSATNTPAGVYTCRMEESDLREIDTVRYTPTFLQQYIPKAIELRITVVGKQVFAAEIHSQTREESRHDWRVISPRYIPHRPHSLPCELEERCVALVEYFGLSFGTIDMIRRPDGEYIFLEINANGQWLWIEEMVGLPISKAIADHLILGGVEPI